MKELTGEEKYLEEAKDIPRLEAEYAQNLNKAINELSEIAFTYGIEIPILIIKDTWIQIGFPYGNRHIIKAPDIKSVETDFGIIKIEKIKSNQKEVE